MGEREKARERKGEKGREGEREKGREGERERERKGERERERRKEREKERGRERERERETVLTDESLDFSPLAEPPLLVWSKPLPLTLHRPILFLLPLQDTHMYTCII